jgi:hypothetical protein
MNNNYQAKWQPIIIKERQSKTERKDRKKHGFSAFYFRIDEGYGIPFLAVLYSDADFNVSKINS